MIGILGGMGTQAGLDFCNKLAVINRGKVDQKYPLFILYNKSNIPKRPENLKKYYNVLKSFQEYEYKNYVLAELKKLTNIQYDGNIRAAYKPAFGMIDASKKDLTDAVRKVMLMGVVEDWIIKNPDGTIDQFKSNPKFKKLPEQQFYWSDNRRRESGLEPEAT